MRKTTTITLDTFMIVKQQPKEKKRYAQTHTQLNTRLQTILKLSSSNSLSHIVNTLLFIFVNCLHWKWKRKRIERERESDKVRSLVDDGIRQRRQTQQLLRAIRQKWLDAINRLNQLLNKSNSNFVIKTNNHAPNPADVRLLK